LQLTQPLFTILAHEFSGKDLIICFGGLFLIYQSTKEIHHKLEGQQGDEHNQIKTSSFAAIIIQMVVLNVVFSIDSVITAVGMAYHQLVWIMMGAVLLSILVMLFAAEYINNFVHKHPTIKILALSFLLLIGFSLLAEGFHVDIPKGYIYFAMSFSLLVELIQLKFQKKSHIVILNEHFDKGEK